MISIEITNAGKLKLANAMDSKSLILFMLVVMKISQAYGYKHLQNKHAPMFSFRRSPPSRVTTTAGITRDEEDEELERDARALGAEIRRVSDSLMVSKCRRIADKEMRSVCERIARNPVLRSMNGSKGYIGEEELSEGRPILSRGFSYFIPVVEPQLFCNERRKCPNYSSGIVARNMDKNLLSLSPWIMCQEYDPSRFPQWLNVAQCLCTGCINPATGIEQVGSIISREFTVEISVIRKTVIGNFDKCTAKTCIEEIIKVAIGCHCSMPIQ